MRVLVLGAGFGGLELTTRLSDEFGDDVDVVLIDQSDGFVFGFSKLDVMFGRALADAVVHPYRDLVKPGVRFVQSTVRSIDPVAKRVETDAGTLRRRHPGRRPRRRPATRPPRRGWSRAATSSTRWPGAFALRDVLASFDGGRVIVGVTSTPFKCPPAPSETALLMHDYLDRARAARHAPRSRWSCRCGVPIPPSPAASQALLAAFAERGIDWHAATAGARARPGSQGRACSATAPRCPTTCSSACPCTGRPTVVRGVGHDRRRMDPGQPADARDRVPGRLRGRRRDERRNARRRASSPKARRQWSPTASPRSSGASRRRREYDGRGLCYLEFGHDQVATVDVTFVSRRRARPASFEGPSPALAADKAEFGASRIQRWFGRTRQ